MATVLTEMTFDDRMRLEQLCHERLRSFFAESLLGCVLHRDRWNTLIIHCPTAEIVDVLLMDLEELSDYAWLILGVEAIALCFIHEEIVHVERCKIYTVPRTIFS